jgi:toxin ParE1/3/4
MAEFRLSPAAERDLEGIWKYTRDEWGLEQAERYVDMLTTTCQALAQSPMSAPACEHIRKGYRRRAAHDLLPRHSLRHRGHSRTA